MKGSQYNLRSSVFLFLVLLLRRTSYIHRHIFRLGFRVSPYVAAISLAVLSVVISFVFSSTVLWLYDSSIQQPRIDVRVVSIDRILYGNNSTVWRILLNIRNSWSQDIEVLSIDALLEGDGFSPIYPLNWKEQTPVRIPPGGDRELVLIISTQSINAGGRAIVFSSPGFAEDIRVQIRVSVSSGHVILVSVQLP